MEIENIGVVPSQALQYRGERGIEVGQLFKLGAKYSNKLNAKFLDENGKEQTCLMGCYGIGVNRIMASAIELGNDKDGISWPISIAPFEVLITCVNQNDEDVVKKSEEIYQALCDKSIDVLLDDRNIRGGVKFKDADLIGIPIRVTVGKKSLEQGNIEIKLRAEVDRKTIPVDNCIDQVITIVNDLKAKLNVDS